MTEIKDSIANQVVLVTGGTGSFGRHFIRTLLQTTPPKKLIVFSRDEFKQHDMRTAGFDHPAIRYFIGDVRDRNRLYRALDGVDIVVHAAALKQITSAEYNPIEAVKTNIMGAANLIDSCIDRGVTKVMALSTDKAANPFNLYGATKLCMEKLFIAGNSYSGSHKTRFGIVRYGNVVGSRGSVVPLFRKLRATGCLPVTDSAMTRFWITLEQAVQFVLFCIEHMEGGEIFVPKIPSMSIMDLVEAIAPECSISFTGIRPGEKLHEVLVTEDEARNAFEFSNHFMILPSFVPWTAKRRNPAADAVKPPDGFKYSSDTNDNWLTIDQLRTILYSEYGDDADPGRRE